MALTEVTVEAVCKRPGLSRERFHADIALSLVRINVRISALPVLDGSENARRLITSLRLFMFSRVHSLSVQCITGYQPTLPIQVGVVEFHCARAPGTAWHRIALDPFSRYPGLHSNRTTEPAENSEPIRLPYRGSGTELH